MKKNPCKNRPVHPLIRLVFLLAEETSPPTTNRMQEKISAVFYKILPATPFLVHRHSSYPAWFRFF